MTELRACAFLTLMCLSLGASAQIYRWVDQNGRVQYSNLKPPKNVTAKVIDPDAKEGPPSADSTECYTIRCQGERMEERERQRRAEDARISNERAAVAPRQNKGLEFRRYLSIQRGMSEGELLGIAGEPDLKADQGIAISAPVTVPLDRNLSGPARAGLRLMTYTYLPTPGDPFTTTITLVGGRVSEIDRVRKF